MIKRIACHWVYIVTLTLCTAVFAATAPALSGSAHAQPILRAKHQQAPMASVFASTAQPTAARGALQTLLTPVAVDIREPLHDGLVIGTPIKIAAPAAPAMPILIPSWLQELLVF